MEVKFLDLTPKHLVDKKAFLTFCRRIFLQIQNLDSHNRDSLLLIEKEHLKKNYSDNNEVDVLTLFFIKSLFIDLLLQGWEIKSATATKIIIEYDTLEHMQGSSLELKEKVRRRHLLARNSQLKNKSVKEFILNMERRRLTPNGWHSIFSLMRDGNKLAEQLTEINNIIEPDRKKNQLKKTIQPYIQFVEKGKKCDQTGLFLSDIWRYFRHTWVNEYKSLPGRSISILIRDAAVPNHPVIGIATLGSSVAQQTVRDHWIGWEGKGYIEKLSANPTTKIAKQLLKNLEDLLKEVYKKDFVLAKMLSTKILNNPDETTIKNLRSKARQYKKSHQLNPHHAKFNVATNNSKSWKDRALNDLYKSKRADLIADLLTIKYNFKKYGLKKGTKTELSEALKTPTFKDAVSRLIRKMKSIKVGIEMMDIVVCGSIAPYNSLLGGKLVCMLLTSPEIVKYYSKKYSHTPSLIASSMTGKELIRKPQLVLLGTTSLYGVGSSQYNRIKIPAEKISGKKGLIIEYKDLGMSEGFGSFHFSSETLKWASNIMSRNGKQRVNSIFGEGANPLIRKIRNVFDLVGYDSEVILKHGNKRVVYGIALAENFREYLLGIEKTPRYIFDLKNPKLKTELIADFWIERWLAKRSENPEIIDTIRKHVLSYPITHGAKVPVEEKDYSLNLFSISNN